MILTDLVDPITSKAYLWALSMYKNNREIFVIILLGMGLYNLWDDIVMKIGKGIMNAKNIVKKAVNREYWGLLSGLVNLRRTHVGGGRKRQLIEQYKSMPHRNSFEYNKKYAYLIDESRSNAGSCGSYYWQDLWAASKIIKNRPDIHYDIGSRIDGFIAHLQAAGQRTVLIDIRHMESRMPYVSFIQADATSLDGIEDESIESISALCSLEHFGLGRYGDDIDPDACFKAMKAIQRVLKRGGHAYIAVPIGGRASRI